MVWIDGRCLGLYGLTCTSWSPLTLFSHHTSFYKPVFERDNKSVILLEDNTKEDNTELHHRTIPRGIFGGSVKKGINMLSPIHVGFVNAQTLEVKFYLSVSEGTPWKRRLLRNWNTLSRSMWTSDEWYDPDSKTKCNPQTKMTPKYKTQVLITRKYTCLSNSNPVTHTSSTLDRMQAHTINNNWLHSLKDFPRQKCLPYQYCP